MVSFMKYLFEQSTWFKQYYYILAGELLRLQPILNSFKSPQT